MKQFYWKGKKVWTVRQVEEQFNINYSRIHNIFNQIKDSLTVGVDYYKMIEGYEVREFEKENHISLGRKRNFNLLTKPVIDEIKKLNMEKETYSKSEEVNTRGANIESILSEFKESLSSGIEMLLQEKDEKIKSLEIENKKLKTELKEVEENTIDQVMIGMGRLITEQINSFGKSEGFSFKMDKNGNLEKLKQ